MYILNKPGILKLSQCDMLCVKERHNSHTLNSEFVVMTMSGGELVNLNLTADLFNVRRMIIIIIIDVDVWVKSHDKMMEIWEIFQLFSFNFYSMQTANIQLFTFHSFYSQIVQKTFRWSIELCIKILHQEPLNSEANTFRCSHTFLFIWIIFNVYDYCLKTEDSAKDNV